MEEVCGASRPCAWADRGQRLRGWNRCSDDSDFVPSKAAIQTGAQRTSVIQPRSLAYNTGSSSTSARILHRTFGTVYIKTLALL